MRLTHGFHEMARNRIFRLNDQIWCRVMNEHGEWRNEITPFGPSAKSLARQFAAERQEHYDQMAGREETPPYRVQQGGEVVYAIALWPQIRPNRLKFGYTGLDVSSRLGVYRTSNPEAKLVACWPGSRSEERHILAMLAGRVRNSEVFDVPDVRAALEQVDKLLGPRCPKSTKPTLDTLIAAGESGDILKMQRVFRQLNSSGALDGFREPTLVPPGSVCNPLRNRR